MISVITLFSSFDLLVLLTPILGKNDVLNVKDFCGIHVLFYPHILKATPLLLKSNNFEKTIKQYCYICYDNTNSAPTLVWSADIRTHISLYMYLWVFFEFIIHSILHDSWLN